MWPYETKSEYIPGWPLGRPKSAGLRLPMLARNPRMRWAFLGEPQSKRAKRRARGRRRGMRQQ